MKQFYLYFNNLTLKNKLVLFSLKGTGFIFFSFLLYILLSDNCVHLFILFNHYFYSIKNILYLFFFFLFNVEYIDLGNTISNLISTDSLCFSFMPSFFIYSSGALLLYCLIGKSSLIKSLFLVSTIASAYASNTIFKFIGEVEYVLHCINTWRKGLGPNNNSVELFVNKNTEYFNQIKDLLDKISDFISSSYVGSTPSTSSFWVFDDLTQIMSNYDAFLETLTLNQKYAIIHILLSFIIFLSISNIVMLYLGDEIIKYLKLEEKYPKLARYIQLRRKFITYNILFDSLIIFLALIVIVGFNLYNFTTL